MRFWGHDSQSCAFSNFWPSFAFVQTNFEEKRTNRHVVPTFCEICSTCMCLFGRLAQLTLFCQIFVYFELLFCVVSLSSYQERGNVALAVVGECNLLSNEPTRLGEGCAHNRPYKVHCISSSYKKCYERGLAIAPFFVVPLRLLSHTHSHLHTCTLVYRT